MLGCRAVERRRQLMAQFAKAQLCAAGLAVVIIASLLSGCSAQESAFCRAVKSSRTGFRTGADLASDRSRQLTQLDAVIATLPDPKDRVELVAVRRYAELIWGTVKYSSPDAQQRDQLKVLSDFYGSASESLDRRLRDDCRINIGGRAKPYGAK